MLLVAGAATSCSTPLVPDSPRQVLSHGWGSGDESRTAKTTQISRFGDAMKFRVETKLADPVGSDHEPFLGAEVYLEVNGAAGQDVRCEITDPARDSNPMSGNKEQWSFHTVCFWIYRDDSAQTLFVDSESAQIFEDGTAY